MSSAVSLDTLVVAGLVVSGAIYLFRGALFGDQSGPAKAIGSNGATANGGLNGVQRKRRSRNFVQVMNETDKNVIVFFGSQTGTAEDYANRIAKEAQKRYGLRCMVADIEDYDMERLDRLPSDHLAIFVVATYGEGEPTDNATEFWNFLIVDSEGDVPTFSRQLHGRSTLHNLRYVMFGLGNRTYEHFNAVARRLDQRFTSLGARRIGERGEGDDDGNLEEDFISWKSGAWQAIAEVMHVSEQSESAHEPEYILTELNEGEYDPNNVYHGELTERRLAGAGTVYDIKRPYMASLQVTRQLFATEAQRYCVHAEVDLRGSNISYTAGDHLAIWPVNSEDEVLRIANACGISKDKLDTVVRVVSSDETAAKKYPFPQPTTYRDIFRHYIDINSCPSREFVALLAAQFVTDPSAKAYLTRLGSDKEAYHREVLECHMNLATLVEQARAATAATDDADTDDKAAPWTIPVAIAIEGLGRLQPRYYSISSSPKMNQHHAHLTAVVVDQEVSYNRRFQGVATNYLLAAHTRLTSDSIVNVNGLANGDLITEQVAEELNDINQSSSLRVRVPVFVRPCSNFKLPRDTTRPVIMVGPGTGVAPFRAFVQERVYLARKGVELGPTILFFGCRHREHDFLYREEWDAYFKELPADKSEMILAFSREQDKKVYVQDRMHERQTDLWRWLHDEQGYFYVCGDAKNMARAVNNQLVTMAQEVGGLDEEQAVQWVKDLRAHGRYQEDVWS
ncbi:NADPH-dependent cytochrome P450 oxidoreductase [Syncephalis plumigaleata]|nr:NADPH-dependent cytochrome P450 oxidoreductase [Syncephalis plumigaleata]